MRELGVEDLICVGLHTGIWLQTHAFLGGSPRLLAHGVEVTHIQMKSMIEIIAMISSTQLSAERSVLFIIGSFLNFK